MKKLYECVYCKSPCTIERKDKKIFLKCPKCGEKEATEQLIKRLERVFE